MFRQGTRTETPARAIAAIELPGVELPGRVTLIPFCYYVCAISKSLHPCQETFLNLH